MWENRRAAVKQIRARAGLAGGHARCQSTPRRPPAATSSPSRTGSPAAPAEAGRLFDRNPNSPAHAAALAVRGSMLLLEKKPAEAELKLRECLTIRRKIQPDDWTTFDTESTLGEALLDQKKFADAEPLLLVGLRGPETTHRPRSRPRTSPASPGPSNAW